MIDFDNLTQEEEQEQILVLKCKITSLLQEDGYTNFSNSSNMVVVYSLLELASEYTHDQNYFDEASDEVSWNTFDQKLD